MANFKPGDYIELKFDVMLPNSGLYYPSYSRGFFHCYSGVLQVKLLMEKDNDKKHSIKNAGTPVHLEVPEDHIRAVQHYQGNRNKLVAWEDCPWMKFPPHHTNFDGK